MPDWWRDCNRNSQAWPATSKHLFKTRFSIAFRLSKYSHVGIVVARGSRTMFQTSAGFAYGTRSFRVPALKAGTYTVRLAATDEAGTFSRITGNLRIS